MWNICRTCTTKQMEMRSIFDQDKSPTIAAMISAISSLEILPNDRLPSEICITCLETLEISYYFKQQVTRSNDTLLKQVDRTTLLARCKMLAQPQANNAVAESQVEEFVANEQMIIASDDVAAEKVAEHPSNCHDPLMMDNDTYDASKCDVSLKIEMPLTNVACDDLPEETYFKDINSHLEETEYKPAINEIDLEEHVVQFGGNCEIAPSEMISNNVTDVDEFCSDDDLPITSVPESTGYNASQNVEDNSNENAEVTGEASEGALKDMGNLSTDNSLKCTHCNILFKRENALKLHMYKHKNPFKCEICQKIFIKSSQLKVHMNVHTGEVTKPYICDVCGKAFFKPSVLEIHMRNHTGERPFQCQECNSKFIAKGALKQHMRTHTGEKPFHCQLCDSKFNSNGGLKQHMRTHSGEKPFHCQQCNFEFNSTGNLKKHMLKHTCEKPFHCQLCNSKFNTKGGLKQHMQTHTGEKPFQCPQCNSKFNTASILKQHMLTHTGEKPFQCEQCNSKFNTKSNLKQHMLTHTGEKPFHCQLCNAKFISKSNLKQHMRRHTGEKPFHCQHCNSKFNSKSTLNQHIRMHTGEKPFHCQLCDSKFYTSGNLKQHMRRHIGEATPAT